MKKNLKIIVCSILILFLSGCNNNISINKDSMDNITIYTSLYPIEYVTKELYGNNATINSIYPAGINPYEYKFTKKQIKDFENSDLVIYNGLNKERDMIVEMVNDNKDLKIIDATARINYNYNEDEIWINPTNLITIAQNIKNGLNEYIDNNYLKKDIDNNYDKLNLKISKLDANIKEDVNNSKTKIIVSSTDNLKVLEKYGLTVYSLQEDKVTEKIISDVEKLIDNKIVQYIYTTSLTQNNKYISEIVKKYPSVKVIELNTLSNITDDDKKNNKNYITIMNENRDKIKKELYK